MHHYLSLITVAVLHVSAKCRIAHHLTKGKSRMFELINVVAYSSVCVISSFQDAMMARVVQNGLACRTAFVSVQSKGHMQASPSSLRVMVT